MSTTPRSESDTSEHHSSEQYHAILTAFAKRDSGTLFAGTHYSTLSELLWASDDIRVGDQSYRPDEPSFITVHELLNTSASAQHLSVRDKTHRRRTSSSARFRLRSIKRFRNDSTFEQLTTLRPDPATSNKIVFLRGYPDRSLLTRLGAALSLDYEFLFQHFSDPRQLALKETYCLPPLSPINTGTIQLTFTTIGTWDNGKSGTSLRAARDMLEKEMGHYDKNLHQGAGLNPCDTIVREFTVYDLKHFVIEQRVTIKLLRNGRAWTIVVCSDCGTSLDSSHCGPWKRMQLDHAHQDVRFLAWPLDYTNRDVSKIVLHKNLPKLQSDTTPASSNDHSEAEGYELEEYASNPGPLRQSLSYLHTDLGLINDDPGLDSADTPFFALNTIFRLLAASENQYLNLMEEKVRLFGKEEADAQGIFGIQLIKKHVDAHVERLRDIVEVISERGGRGWVSASASGPIPGSPLTIESPAEEAAHYLHRTFRKLHHRAEAVSAGCRDEIATLSSSAVVKEAQRSMRQTSAIAKVTFIASVFVPLSFTTSIFGMDLKEFGDGVSYTTFLAVMIPVIVVSVLAWWVDMKKLRRVGGWFGIGHGADERAENSDEGYKTSSR